MHTRLIAAVALFSFVFPVLAASPQVKKMEVDEDQVTIWNRFATKVYELHKQRLAGRDIRKSETTGEYGGVMAKGYFYKETSYHDARSGLLLSRVRADRDKPETLHIVEVFLYNDQGQVVRDYAAIYLPWARNAPIRTMINVHRHKPDLHAYRQFDASGNRIYEKCQGTTAGTQVEISLEQQDINARSTASDAYRNCFVGIQDTAGVYLSPQ